jgi:hypothetical protein
LLVKTPTRAENRHVKIAIGIVPTYKTGVLVGENTNKGGNRHAKIAIGIVPTYKTGVLVGENTNKGGKTTND